MESDNSYVVSMKVMIVFGLSCRWAEDNLLLLSEARSDIDSPSAREKYSNVISLRAMVL